MKIVLWLSSLLFSSQLFGMNADTYFQSNSLVSLRLHPAGSFVAKLEAEKESQAISLCEVATSRCHPLIDSEELSTGEGVIHGLHWIDDYHLAVEFGEVKKGIKDLLDTRFSRKLYILSLDTRYRLREVKTLRTGGVLIDPLLEEKDNLLYSKSGTTSKIYRLKVSGLAAQGAGLSKLTRLDGGQFVPRNEVASVEGYAVRWFMDDSNQATAVLRYRDKNILVLDQIAGQEQRQLHEWETDQDTTGAPFIVPVAQADAEGVFYALDFAEEEERSVYRVDYTSGETRLLYEIESFKILDLVISPQGKRLIGVKVLKDGKIDYEYLAQKMSPDTAHNTRDELLEFVLERSRQKMHYLLYRERHNQPGHFVVADLTTNRRHTVGSFYPHLRNTLNSRQVEGSVNVQGLTIPYLLTLPAHNGGAEGRPLIVMPHGGPIGVFDSRYFDLHAQYFAQQGFAVLRVNFRGSGGYSPELKAAGKREFGEMMLTDIHSAVLDVAQRRDINAQQICAVGFSYGGYAATMLTIKHPAIYRCAVTVAGVSDINLMLNAAGRTVRQDTWGRDNIGDSHHDYDVLKSQSPVYLAQQLQRPIFIAHGEADRIVDIEHAYRLGLMLQTYKKPFQWKVYPDWGHSLVDEDVSADLFDRIVTFVRRHI